MGTDTQQTPSMVATPQREHQWLQKFVGEWDVETEIPEQPGEVMRGSEVVRSLDGLWVLGEGKADMPEGGQMTMLTLMGYDPAQGKFVGTFVASVMTQLWIYEGTLDEETDTLTLRTQGPDMVTGELRQFTDVVKFEGPDHRVLTGHILDEHGEWQVMMRGHYRRRG